MIAAPAAAARAVLSAVAMRTIACAAVAAIVGLGRLGAAAAQNSDAEALFTEAEGLEAAGRVAEACESFDASNRIEPRAGTLIRLGHCRETQGRLASAWSAYKDALTRVKDPRKRELAEAQIAALEGRLSFLTISVPDESRIDGMVVSRNGTDLDRGLWNRGMPVDGGTYVIAARAPGREPWSTTVEVGNERDRASVEVPRFVALALVTEKKVIAPAAVHRETPRRSGLSMRRKLALGSAAAGALALGGGIALGLQSRGLADDASALCPSPSMPCADAGAAEAIHQRARTRALYANVAYGTAAAAATAAVVLWLTGRPEARRSSLTILPRAGAGAAALDVAWRF